MKVTKQLLAALLLSTLGLQACSQSSLKEDAMYEMSVEESPQEAYETKEMTHYDMHSDAIPPLRSVRFTPPALAPTANDIPTLAASSQNDGNKRFIRTASLEIKVADISEATHAIENIIIQKKGFIISSDIRNEHQYTEETLIAKDTLLVTTHSKLTGTLTLRVHYTLLDATLREIAPLAQSISYRSVRANDVTLNLLRSHLEQEREKKKGQRITSITGNNKGHKLEDLLEAEEAINTAQEAQDEALLSKLAMEDQIEYSTIIIGLLHDPITLYTKKLVSPIIKEYKPSFISLLGSSIANGWQIVLDVLLFTISIWPVLMFILAAIILYRYYRKRRTKSAE